MPQLITYLDTPAGPCAYIAVGATCVSRIHMSYDELLTHEGKPAKAHTYPRPIPIEKGGEIGMFEMGSTVILLFQPGRVRWAKALAEGAVVRMGARIGEWK